jgi:hypothetical protein
MNEKSTLIDVKKEPNSSLLIHICAYGENELSDNDSENSITHYLYLNLELLNTIKFTLKQALKKYPNINLIEIVSVDLESIIKPMEYVLEELELHTQVTELRFFGNKLLTQIADQLIKTLKNSKSIQHIIFDCTLEGKSITLISDFLKERNSISIEFNKNKIKENNDLQEKSSLDNDQLEFLNAYMKIRSKDKGKDKFAFKSDEYNSFVEMLKIDDHASQERILKTLGIYEDKDT